MRSNKANLIMRVAVLLEVVTALATGAALLRLAVGPVRIDVWSLSLSVRSVWRPLLCAALAFAARCWLDRGSQRAALIAFSASRAISGGVLCAGMLGWWVFLSATCGGADSYGYVSTAGRLLDARLVQPEPLARLLPFGDAISAATPLGYTPSPRIADASVPVYPLGLPALMALATVLFGAIGPFVVAPLSGLLLVGAVVVAARQATRDRELTLTAAALTAVHPVVFTYAIQPMSDVPAAAFFAVAVAALLHQPAWPVVGGTAAALCLLIRPALAPALAALIVLPMLERRRLDIRAALGYGIPAACGVALLFASQWYLYGHPLANGYADMSTLFSIDRIGVNARSHGYWAWRTLGPVFLGAAAIGFVVLTTRVRWAIAMVAATVVAPYLAYRTFDHWETLRFLLPALVVLTIPAAAGLLGLTRRLAGEALGRMVASLLVLLLAQFWTGWLAINNVFTMPDHERRHRLAGELVAQTAPAHAVVLAHQHSGSIRYYTQRSSVNWERIPTGAMDGTVAALQTAGHPVFLLIDSDEERAAFERRHGPTASWLPAGQRRNVQLFEARTATTAPR